VVGYGGVAQGDRMLVWCNQGPGFKPQNKNRKLVELMVQCAHPVEYYAAIQCTDVAICQMYHVMK
jgi:hypothetical protein